MYYKHSLYRELPHETKHSLLMYTCSDDVLSKEAAAYLPRWLKSSSGSIRHSGRLVCVVTYINELCMIARER